MRKSKKPLIERFAVKYIPEPNSGCWLWLGARDPRGYGRLSAVTWGQSLAHRVSYELHVGTVPAGLFVCHHCDIPPCVNPEHLFVGTQIDNMVDLARKGKHPLGRRRHCKHGHEYTPENTAIRVRPERPGHSRVCITCRNISNEERYHAG